MLKELESDESRNLDLKRLIKLLLNLYLEELNKYIK